MNGITDSATDKLAALTTDLYFAAHTLGQNLPVAELRARLRVVLARMLDDVTQIRMDALRDALVEQLPPITGGGHTDDFEEISEEFLTAPDEWPADYHADIDGWLYETGPTPLSVLAADRKDFPHVGKAGTNPNAYEPTAADWLDYFEARDASWTETDQLISHGVI